jgi:hypothetical protein
MPLDLLRRAASPFRKFGWGAGSLYVIDRLLRRVSPHLGLYVYEFMVQPVGGKPLLPPGLSRNLSFVEIGRGHPDLALMPALEDIKVLRFEQGARCIATYRKGQLLGYSWYCTDRYEEDEVRCTYELADRAASIFDFDLYVMPQHRLGVGFVAVWFGVNETLWPRGVRYTFSRLTRFNLESRRAHAHLGWKRVGTGVFLKVGRLECMVANLAPYIAVTWGPRQRVKLTLRHDVLSQAASPVAESLESPR